LRTATLRPSGSAKNVAIAQFFPSLPVLCQKVFRQTYGRSYVNQYVTALTEDGTELAVGRPYHKGVPHHD
jgi:hypothetical protein